MISYIFLDSSSNLKYNNITPFLALSFHAFFLLSFFYLTPYLSASPSSLFYFIFSFTPDSMTWTNWVSLFGNGDHKSLTVIFNSISLTLSVKVYGHHFSNSTLLRSCDEIKRRNTCLHDRIWSFWSSNLDDKNLDEFTAITNILLSSYLHIRVRTLHVFSHLTLWGRYCISKFYR